MNHWIVLRPALPGDVPGQYETRRIRTMLAICNTPGPPDVTIGYPAAATLWATASTACITISAHDQGHRR
jgi:hypothetical protein